MVLSGQNNEKMGEKPEGQRSDEIMQNEEQNSATLQMKIQLKG